MSSEDPTVTKFREYLHIRTEQRNPDYDACMKFLAALADELSIEHRIIEPKPGFPFMVMTIPGKEPNLPALMLHSHTDVVPVSKEHWQHDPFGAEKENGKIYGRGTQDMKCNGIQYVEAIRRLFKNGVTNFKRTIHIVWGPDEELGSHNGMERLVKHPDFKKLNVGFVMDEGMASENDTYKVFYAERCKWWFRVTFLGPPGHGSRFIEDSAAEKMQRFVLKAYQFRSKQQEILKKDPKKTLGDVTSLNLTVCRGGVETNVVPAKFECEFDMRVTPSTNFEALQAEIDSWVKFAGEGTKIEWILHKTFQNTTPTTKDDSFWKVIEATLEKENCQFTKEIFPCGTDCGLIRATGVRVIGFSPIINTPVLLHCHDEYLDESVFLRGIDIYEKLIPALANVEE